MSEIKNILLAIVFFTLSTFLTWWFVDGSSLYTSTRQQILSTSIAGAKWAIQIIAALIFLQNKKWRFIKNIGFTCFVGSLILAPYPMMVLDDRFDNEDPTPYFTSSLVIAVIVMIILYFFSVKRLGLSMKWFWGWIICLGIAVTLQLTVVFSVIKF